MPERLGLRTFDTSDVQGDGSYIKLRGATVGEIIGDQVRIEEASSVWYKIGRFFGRVFRKKPPRSLIIKQQVARSISHVRDWNWVDDGGDLLPLPSVDPDVVNRLTSDEMRCINECINGDRQSEEQKN